MNDSEVKKQYRQEVDSLPKKKNTNSTEVKKGSKATTIKLDGKDVIVPNLNIIQGLEKQINTLRQEVDSLKTTLHRLNIELNNLKK